MDKVARNKQILSKYVPEPAVETLVSWIYKYDIKLKIRKARSTRLGDYTPPNDERNHLITVNHDLNPYAFLITFVHEVAHLTTWNKHKNRVSPHGQEWKQEFKLLMYHFYEIKVFPSDVELALKQYMLDPAAASCSDLRLMRALKKHDEHDGTVHLEQLPMHAKFIYNKDRFFIKGERIRKRFKCVEVGSNKVYLFSPIAEVEPFQN